MLQIEVKGIPSDKTARILLWLSQGSEFYEVLGEMIAMHEAKAIRIQVDSGIGGLLHQGAAFEIARAEKLKSVMDTIASIRTGQTSLLSVKFLAKDKP